LRASWCGDWLVESPRTVPRSVSAFLASVRTAPGRCSYVTRSPLVVPDRPCFARAGQPPVDAAGRARIWVIRAARCTAPGRSEWSPRPCGGRLHASSRSTRPFPPDRTDIGKRRRQTTVPERIFEAIAKSTTPRGRASIGRPRPVTCPDRIAVRAERAGAGAGLRAGLLAPLEKKAPFGRAVRGGDPNGNRGRCPPGTGTPTRFELRSGETSMP